MVVSDFLSLSLHLLLRSKGRLVSTSGEIKTVLFVLLVEMGTGADATVFGGGEGVGVEEASCTWYRAALCLPRSRSAGPR